MPVVDVQALREAVQADGAGRQFETERRVLREM